MDMDQESAVQESTLNLQEHTFAFSTTADVTDLTIRTSDEHVFHLHKLTMRMASSVFDGMILSAEQSPLTVEESSTTLLALLSFIYPNRSPTIFDSLDTIIPVLKAADKYDMQSVIFHLSAQICASPSVFGRKGDKAMKKIDPLRVYIISEKLGLKNLEAQVKFAVLTMDLETAEDSPELDTVTASWYRRLRKKQVQYREWYEETCDEYRSRDHMCPMFDKRFTRKVGWFQIPNHTNDYMEAFPNTVLLRKLIDEHMSCQICLEDATEWLTTFEVEFPEKALSM